MEVMAGGCGEMEMMWKVEDGDVDQTYEFCAARDGAQSLAPGMYTRDGI